MNAGLSSSGRTGVLVGGRTLFLAIDALYPECSVFTREHPNLRPLTCIENGGCHLGLSARCMETLARRLGRLFDEHERLDRVVLYWRTGGETLGAAFDRRFSPPRVRRIRTAVLGHYLRTGEPLDIPASLLG